MDSLPVIASKFWPKCNHKIDHGSQVLGTADLLQFNATCGGDKHSILTHRARGAVHESHLALGYYESRGEETLVIGGPRTADDRCHTRKVS